MGIFLLFSCAKKNNSNPNTSNTLYVPKFSATIDGVNWIPDSMSSSISDTLSSKLIEISAYKSDGTGIQIPLPYGIAPGAYRMSETYNPGVIYHNTVNGLRWYYISSSGKLVVTSNSNNVVAGTFNGYVTYTFNGNDSLSVTNGVFNIKY